MLVSDRRPAMGLYPVAAAVALEAAGARRGDASAIVDERRSRRAPTSRRSTSRDGEPYWLPPGRRDAPWLVSERDRAAPVRRARGQRSHARFAFLGRLPQRPARRQRSCSSSRTSSSPPPADAWLDAVAHGWDVVPVVIQDPVWEQSFPEVARRRRAGRRPAERSRRARPPSRPPGGARCASDNEQRLARAARRARVARPRAGAISARATRSTIDRAFVEWAEERRRRRWAR